MFEVDTLCFLVLNEFMQFVYCANSSQFNFPHQENKKLCIFVKAQVL